LLGARTPFVLPGRLDARHPTPVTNSTFSNAGKP